MKLKSLKVNGYKNLIDCELNFENLSILIGANNSGKSNVLEVFSFLDSGRAIQPPWACQDWKKPDAADSPLP